jgi:hypothetical protein
MRLLPLLLVAVAATLPLALANDHDEFSEESGRHKYDYFGENSGESSEESLEDASVLGFFFRCDVCCVLMRCARCARCRRETQGLTEPDVCDRYT